MAKTADLVHFLHWVDEKDPAHVRRSAIEEYERLALEYNRESLAKRRKALGIKDKACAAK